MAGAELAAEVWGEKEWSEEYAKDLAEADAAGDANAGRVSFTVAPITWGFRGINVEVRVGRADGLGAESVVNLDDILTVHRQVIANQITRFSADKMREVEEAMRFALQLLQYQR